MDNKSVISIENLDIIIKLFGQFDENIRVIESDLDVKINSKDNEIEIIGSEENCKIAEDVITELIDILRNGDNIDKTKIHYCIDLAKDGYSSEISEIMQGVIAVTARGKQIKSKTIGQKKYVNALKNNTLVFGVGPAGTGKTYLAVATAVASFKNKEVQKIILTRPAVEAGEKLGFLPGDLQTKVDPYLRPLYDALQEMLGLENYTKLLERGEIEIAPLAYMRGRTLNNAYIILDEAQNTTSEQMKMFLTRMGEGSKVVVTGDITQIDLPEGKISGLKQVIKVLDGLEDIAIVRLTHKDVVRHSLVQRIINAYDKYFSNTDR